MLEKSVAICTVAVDGLPAFICNKEHMQALADAGHSVIMLCPTGTEEMIADGWGAFENLIIKGYSDTESGIIRALNSVLNDHFDWKQQDLLLVNNANCAITPDIVKSMQTDMHSFERRVLGSPRMNIDGWYYLEAEDADFAVRSLPQITRVPFPTSICAFVKGKQFAMFGPFDESYSTLEGALRDFALKINAFGFDSVMLNHVFVEVLGDEKPLPTSGERDWHALKKRFDYLDDTIYRFKMTGLDPVSRMLEVVKGTAHRKPKILLDYSNMPPFHCGTSEYQLGILKCLTGRYKGKYDLCVFANREGASFHDLNRYCNNVVFDEKELGIYDLGFFATQPTEIERQLILNLHCARIVYTMLDAILLRCNYLDTDAFASTIDAVRCGLENSDGVIAISDYSKQDTLDFFQDDPIIVNKSMRRIYVASDFGNDIPIGDTSVDQDIPFDRYTLIAGNGFAHKALKEAIGVLKESDKNFIVVGYGSNEYLYPNVFGFTNGLISDEMLVKLYREADAFVFPSVYEGFGLPIVNALKSGKTVIAHRNELNIELKNHLGSFADSVVFFDVFDELPSLVDSIEPCPPDALSAPDTWEMFTEHFCEYIDELIAKPVDLDELRARYYRYAAIWQQSDKQNRVANIRFWKTDMVSYLKTRVYQQEFAGHPLRIAILNEIQDALFPNKREKLGEYELLY